MSKQDNKYTNPQMPRIDQNYLQKIQSAIDEGLSSGQAKLFDVEEFKKRMINSL